jgi:hypothetical protein
MEEAGEASEAGTGKTKAERRKHTVRSRMKTSMDLRRMI